MKILVISDARIWMGGDHDPFKFRYITFVDTLQERGHTLSHIKFNIDQLQTNKVENYIDSSDDFFISLPQVQTARAKSMKRKLMEVTLPHRRLPYDEMLTQRIEYIKPDLLLSFMGTSPRLIRNISRMGTAIHFAEEDFLKSYPPAATPSLWQRMRVRIARPLIRRLMPCPKEVVMISEKERNWAKYFFPRSRIEMISLFIDEPFWFDKNVRVATNENIEIFVIGNFLDLRNAMGLKQFLEELLITRPTDTPTVTLASREGIHPILENFPKSRLDFIGNVSDPREYYDVAKICLVPAFNVSGVKNQILQGWARNCPVVAKSATAETAGGQNRVDLLVGNTPRELVASALEALADTDLRRALSRNGRQRLVKNFSASGAVDRLCSLVEQNNGQS